MTAVYVRRPLRLVQLSNNHNLNVSYTFRTHGLDFKVPQRIECKSRTPTVIYTNTPVVNETTFYSPAVKQDQTRVLHFTQHHYSHTSYNFTFMYKL